MNDVLAVDMERSSTKITTVLATCSGFKRAAARGVDAGIAVREMAESGTTVESVWICEKYVMG